jgi:hypothetical protein
MNRSVFAITLLLAGASLPGAVVAHPKTKVSSAESSVRAATMGDAATRFLATLDTAQREKLVRSLNDNGARTDWSNLPSTAYPRSSLALGELSDAQRIAFHDLLAASMSAEGYGEATTIMWIDDILRGIQAEQLANGAVPAELRSQAEKVQQSFSSGNYWISLFGDPKSMKWSWMINGHHFVANFTVVDGRIAFTPLFLGANPQTIQKGPYAGWRVLDHEIAGGFAMIASLNPKQQKAALISETIDPKQFTGKGRKDTPLSDIGLSGDRLTTAQYERLMSLVEEFVGFANHEASIIQLAAIRAADPKKLRFAWWGSADDRSKRFMYRISGPSILIEYVREPNQQGGPANHVHAIVRDPSNDYGEDWLSQHYTETPHP